MLASQRCSNHARDTETGLVKPPRRQQLINGSSLLRNAVQFGDKPGIVSHASGIEERREAEERSKEQVQQQMRALAANGTPHNSSEPVGAYEEERSGKYASHPRLRQC